MDKVGYLKSLRSRLHRLPEHEIAAALVYYEEYFDEAGEENEQQVISQLGPPSQVAAQILADLAVKDLDAKPASTKRNISAIWLIILAILSAPISLPLLGGAIALVFGFGAVIISFIFAMLALVISLVFGGLVTFVSGFTILTDHWPTALLFIGIGLIVLGIGILLFSPFFKLIKKISLASADALARLFKKIVRKKERL